MSAKCVLIVDGDADSRTVYRILLQYHGYTVLETADGEEGARLAVSGSVEAVVTELTLHRLDGFGLLQRLRTHEDTRALPIIVLTARAVPDERTRALHAGCTKFLTKPIEPQELVQTIRELIGEA